MLLVLDFDCFFFAVRLSALLKQQKDFRTKLIVLELLDILLTFVSLTGWCVLGQCSRRETISITRTRPASVCMM